MSNKKKIAILLGDPSGIGPQLTSKLLNEKITEEANIVVIGEKKIFEDGEKISGKKTNLKFVNSFDEIKFDDKTKFFLDISKGTNRIYKYGEVSAESGASVLESMDKAMELVNSKKIDAINFAPMNKTSLMMGGCPYNDEHDYFQNKLNMKEFCCEFNVVDNFWTARVTSHIPIKEVPANITRENILKPIKLLDKTLKMSGIERPRIAVQALILTQNLEQKKKMKSFQQLKKQKKWELTLMDLCLAILLLLQLLKIKITTVLLACIMMHFSVV